MDSFERIPERPPRPEKSCPSATFPPLASGEKDRRAIDAKEWVSYKRYMAWRRLLAWLGAPVAVFVIFMLVKTEENGASKIAVGPDDPSTAAPTTEDSLLDRAEKNREPSDPVERSGEYQGATAFEIQVVDQAGHPVPQAALWPTEPSRRVRLASDSERPLAFSDDQGLATLSGTTLSRLNTAGETISVLKTGFVASEVPLPSLGEQPKALVVLYRAQEQHVMCIDMAGQPVSGVDIGLSQNSFDPSKLAAISEGGTIGSSPHTAIHTATTDLSGEAVLTGLERGHSYHLRVNAPSMGIVEMTPGGYIEVPHDANVIVRLAPIYAAVIQVVNDGVVSHAISMRDWFKTSGRARWATRPARKHLERRFPGAIVSTAVFDERNGAEPNARLSLLLAQRGPIQVPIKFVPIDEIGDGQTLDATQFEDEGPDMEAGSLVFVDEAGLNPPISECRVRVPGYLNGHIAIKLPLGNFRLPRGSYELECRNPWLSKSMDSPSIRVPGDNAVILSGEFRKCRFDVDFEWGRGGTPAYSLLIQAAGEEQFSLQASGAASISTWLPIGEAKLQLRIAEVVVREHEFTVERDAAFGVQDVVVLIEL